LGVTTLSTSVEDQGITEGYRIAQAGLLSGRVGRLRAGEWSGHEKPRRVECVIPLSTPAEFLAGPTPRYVSAYETDVQRTAPT
jgi:hypothetical protein